MTNTAHDHNPAAGAASTWRMPAEWAPHERCLTAWPTREGLWGPYFDEAKAEYAATANAIREFEPVRMIANPGQADEVRTACSGAVEAVELASTIRVSGIRVRRRPAHRRFVDERLHLRVVEVVDGWSCG